MKIPKIITGAETVDDNEHPINSLISFYKAFNARDAETTANNWAKKYAVAMSNPIGGIGRNWNAIKEGYDKIMGGDAKVYVEYHDFNFHLFDGIFYVEGRERGSLDTGAVQLGLKIRTTRLYKLFDDGWKQVHHHGSMDDPELLQRYQQAIFNTK